jgi:hypothetical protein
MNNDNKTTISALLVVGSQVIKLVGIEIPSVVVDGISIIGTLLWGYFTNKK